MWGTENWHSFTLQYCLWTRLWVCSFTGTRTWSFLRRGGGGFSQKSCVLMVNFPLVTALLSVSALFRRGREMEFGGGVHYVLPPVLDTVCQPVTAPVSPGEHSQQSELYSLWRDVQLAPISVLPPWQKTPPEGGTEVYHMWESFHSGLEQEETHGNNPSCFYCHAVVTGNIFWIFPHTSLPLL